MESGCPVPTEWEESVSEVLIGTSDIAKRINELAAILSMGYTKLNPILIVVLKGSFIFASDLSRALPFPHELEFIRASSYQGTNTTGNVRIQGLEKAKLKDRHLIVIEDIVDTGLTLRCIYRNLKDAGAASIKCCTLLEKETTRRQEFVPEVDFVAFRIPDKFVVGYGLDFDQRLRHLSFVGVYRQ